MDRVPAKYFFRWYLMASMCDATTTYALAPKDAAQLDRATLRDEEGGSDPDALCVSTPGRSRLRTVWGALPDVCICLAGLELGGQKLKLVLRLVKCESEDHFTDICPFSLGFR
jgi:hypothetical protein